MIRRHYEAWRYAQVLREVVAAKAAGMGRDQALADLTILSLDRELAIQLWNKA